MGIRPKDVNHDERVRLTQLFRESAPKLVADTVTQTYTAPEYASNGASVLASDDALFHALEFNNALEALDAAPPRRPKAPARKREQAAPAKVVENKPRASRKPTTHAQHALVRNAAAARPTNQDRDLRPRIFREIEAMASDLGQLYRAQGASYKPPHKIFVLDGRGQVTAVLLVIFAIVMLLVAGMFQAFAPQKKMD